MGDRLVMVGCELFYGYGERVAVVAGKNKEEREFKRQELQQKYRRVVEVGSSSKLPQGFDHLQATADIIHFYHHKEEVEVKEVIILADLLTPSGWDMVKLMFPNRDFSSDNQGNLVVTTDELSPLLWGQHLVEPLHQPTATAPTASA